MLVKVRRTGSKDTDSDVMAERNIPLVVKIQLHCNGLTSEFRVTQFFDDHVSDTSFKIPQDLKI